MKDSRLSSTGLSHAAHVCCSHTFPQPQHPFLCPLRGCRSCEPRLETSAPLAGVVLGKGRKESSCCLVSNLLQIGEEGKMLPPFQYAIESGDKPKSLLGEAAVQNSSEQGEHPSGLSVQD